MDLAATTVNYILTYVHMYVGAQVYIHEVWMSLLPAAGREGEGLSGKLLPHSAYGLEGKRVWRGGVHIKDSQYVSRYVPGLRLRSQRFFAMLPYLLTAYLEVCV